MRLLVTGANGLLGLNLSLEAMRSHAVVGVDRGRLVGVPFEVMQLDLTNSGAIARALEVSRAETVIHCAAIADVDACERDPELARRLNADLPGQLASECARRGTQLVHISTDAVFDGARPGEYTEDDEPHPRSVYAATKLAGERAVLGEHHGAIVVRVNFYGWSVTGARSLAEFFFNNLSVGKQSRGFTDVVFCPMFVSDLVAVLLRMVQHGLTGLFHAVGAEPMSKYEFGVAIARRFGFDEILIQPASVADAGLAARRAPNLRLSIHKLSTALKAEYPRFSTGMDEFYTQFQQGYPQRIHSYQQQPSPVVEPASVDPGAKGSQE